LISPKSLLYLSFKQNQNVDMNSETQDTPMKTITLILILSLTTYTAFSNNKNAIDQPLAIISVSSQAITLSFDTAEVEHEVIHEDNQSFDNYFITDEGFTYELGRPILPAVTRIVIVPPDAGLELVVQSGTPRTVHADNPPQICTDESLETTFVDDTPSLNGIYPSEVAEMSEPFVVRGVRMVRVTTYPVRYDPESNAYLHYDHIETEIRFTNEAPINPAYNPLRRNRSPEFIKFIRDFAINGVSVGRDDPDCDSDPEYIGHYLIVVHENCLEYAVPFIEWRRKSGWKVDIFCLSNNDALVAATIKRGIQERYDAYLNERIDPFDQILLIGDLSAYNNLNPPPNWILASSGHHNDWYYAQLEGNDNYADVGISRWCSGNRDLMELFVLKTMAYEAEPYMDDTDWFTRGVVYAQYWGRNYHVSLPTNVRWGRMVLESLGFDDIRVHEHLDGPDVNILGPFLAQQYNSGVNVMIGRAENYYFRGRLPGLNENVIFPIDMYLGGHQEYSVWTLLRLPTSDHPMGPVAVTCGWGNPGTFMMSVIWLEQVSGFLLSDLTFGWARLKALMGPGGYIPNWDNLAARYRTDIMYYGDPGIQYWKGVPQEVEAEFPRMITPLCRSIEVRVTDAGNDENVESAQVTLYVPGHIPDPGDLDYAEYDEMFMLTTRSGIDGCAQFILDDDAELEGRTAYITITGREILPYFGEMSIRDNITAIDLSDYALTETEGNDDGDLNPGETFELELVARNLSDRDEMENVTAIVTCSSPWIEIIENNEITFDNINPEEESEGDRAIVIRIHPSCPDGTSRSKTRPRLSVEFRCGDDTYHSTVELVPLAPNFTFRRIIGGDQITTRPRNFDVYINNIGAMDAPEMTARLEAISNDVSVLIDEVDYPAIRAGRYRHVADDRFRIQGDETAVPGSRHDMILILTTEDGFIDTVYFDIQVGEVDDDSPTGPDDYGYLCFDNTDDDWDLAPDYDWWEISLRDPDRDFDGVLIDFDGRSPHDIGETMVIDLPFETQFYGRIYDEITVATNGFISMGDQEWVTNFQNWPLDRAFGGGVGMLAPFWDNLEIANNGGVYYYYDEGTGSFVIEWYKMRHRQVGNSDLIFQVILYDRDVWITSSGDQNILFQYKQISNVPGIGDHWSNAVPYASVGISSPDGTTGINYTFNNVYPATAAQLRNRRALLFSTSTHNTGGVIFGNITDEANGEPVEEAVINTQHNFSAISDNDGFYVIENALAEVEFNITCSKQGYNDSTYTELFLQDEDSLELNFSLLHPEFVPSQDAFGAALAVGEVVDLEFEVHNIGNGPLIWHVEKRLREEIDTQPWDLRRQLPASDETGDSRIQGTVYIDDHFYIAGYNQPDPCIYILNRNGELIDQFPQCGNARWGFKDLAWDGECIWGSGDERIYAFSQEGEAIVEFEGPHNPNNNFAWDTDRNLLWVSNITSDIVGIDGEGNEIEELSRHNFHIYGLAYWPDDPDNYPLYIFHKENNIADQIIHKMNPETEDTMFVRILEPPDGGNSYAAHISNTYDVHSWVFMAVINDGANDRIDIWQLDARLDWFELDPVSGILNPDDTEEFTLILDASNMPSISFEADLVFHHNADDGLFELPVTLDVLGARRNVILDLREGWNLTSINVIPDNLDVREIVRPLLEDGILGLVKDGLGRFYQPHGLINIPRWEVCEGYLIHVSEPAQLEISGIVIPSDRPIDLVEGWNMTAYFPTVPSDVITALSDIEEQLIIAKDIEGHFYLPEFDYSNMAELHEHWGYQFKVREPVQLVYRIGDRNAALAMDLDEPEHFGQVAKTDANMSILVSRCDNPVVYKNSELAVYAQSGHFIGAGKFDDTGRCGFAAWGDNTIINEPLVFKLWDGETDSEVEVEPLDGAPIWTANSHFVGQLKLDYQTVVEFGIHGSYPNPTNGPIQFVYGLEMDSNLGLFVYDLSGRRIATLVNDNVKTGYHRAVWDTELVASGVYLVRLEGAGSIVDMVKVVVVK